MGRDVNIGRAPFGPEVILGFGGSLATVAAGLVAAAFAVGLVGDIGSSLPPLLRTLVLLMGLFATGFGVFLITMVVRELVDDSFRLCLTDESLIDLRARPPRITRWDDVIHVSLMTTTINRGRVGVTLTLTLCHGGEVKIQILDLDRDPEVIARLVADRVDAVVTEKMRRNSADTEFMIADLLAGKVARPPDSEMPSGKCFCRACCGLSPKGARACYQCGAPLL